MQRLRVVTLNLWNKSGRGEGRRELIRDELRRLQPDVVGLQEVMRMESPHLCQAEELNELCGGGFEVAYGRASPWSTGLWMGNAVLSRHPITETQTFALPNHGVDRGRSLTLARLQTPAGSLPFFVTHLSWRYHEGYVRLQQAQEVARLVKAHAPILGLPPVLCGDFNAEPDSDEIRFLRGLHVAGGQSTYFADAHAWKGEGAGHTWDVRNPFTEPEGLNRRIDYIFVRGPDHGGRGRVQSAGLCFDQPVAGVFPSDHFGVVADLRVEGGEVAPLAVF